MPKEIFMTKYLQGDKNAAFIIYVANSKQIPSAIGKKEMIFSNAFCTHYCLKRSNKTYPIVSLPLSFYNSIVSLKQ